MAFCTCMLFYSTSSSSSSLYNNARLFLLMLIIWWLLLPVNTSSPSPISHSPSGVHKQGTLCREMERKALLTFKAGLADDAGRLSSWSDDPNCCNWKGVTCNNQTRHVLKLNLRIPSQDMYYPEKDLGFVLGGNISSSLLELKYLQYLDLSRNSFFYSTIPSFFGSLEKLRYLNLSSSDFFGIVPPHLGNLSKLHYLDLGRNSLEVDSLEWVRGLSSLKHLNLDSVDLKKAGPDWLKAFSMLPSLSGLNLIDCGLSNHPFLMNQYSINLTSLSTLDLSWNDFGSSFDMPSWLFNLSGLTNLQLSHCSLGNVGGIPDEIGKLVELQQLDLSSNDIGGRLPVSLGNLSNLVILRLLHNGIEGSIPGTCGYLCKLRTLDMYDNNLEGELNEFFDGLARCSKNLETSLLGSLDLSRNSFRGSIPETMGQLSELVELYLSGNGWKGVVTATHFEKHKKLQVLELLTSSSEGNLVMDVRVPPFTTSLTEVSLNGVKMRSFGFPAWIQTLSKLESLSLVDCGISGSIPVEFWKSCPNITKLFLSDNAISIGTSFKNLKALLPLSPPADKLELLFLDNNSFSSNSGEIKIPSNMNELAPNLYTLDLSSNSISRTIPLSICKLKQLRFLTLGNNLLTGELTHPHWEEMKYLWGLDVSNNRLVGQIPKSFNSLTFLRMLLFNDNSLEGEIPNFRSNTLLRVVDFGGNNLTGKIPAYLAENNGELLVLRLRDNMLSGTIPPELCLLSNLQTLDLAHNSFQGTIPWCLGNLSTLDEDRVNFLTNGIRLVTKGRDYKYDSGVLSLVHLVDLSDNNLSGQIPESLMNLTLMQTLNLSMNHLTGEIPPNIGVLQKLESLDLSQNHLSGRIPQSLSAISSLSYLNLSHNNLSGRIPSSRQLQTLAEPSKYEGNPLLCGLPLPTKCSGDGTPKVHEGEGEEKAEHHKRIFDLEKWGFILTVVLGFFVGFWGVCGSLLLKASWRQAYFGYLAGIKEKIIVMVAVNVACLQRKMADVRMTK